MTLGNTIARLREQQGWSQGQLAMHAQMQPTQISRIERDVHKTINGRTIAKLAMALGVRTDYIMAEAGWLDQEPQSIRPSSAEQRLLDIIHQIPSSDIRSKVLEQFTWIAQVARDADLARVAAASPFGD